MRIDMYLWGLLVAGFAMFVGMSLFSSFHDNYGIPNANTGLFNETYTQLGSVRGEQKDMEGVIAPGGDDDIDVLMAKKSFPAVKGIYSSVNMSGKILNTMIKEVGFGDEQGSEILSYFVNTLMIGLGVMFLLTIIYFIFRFQPRE